MITKSQNHQNPKSQNHIQNHTHTHRAQHSKNIKKSKIKNHKIKNHKITKSQNHSLSLSARPSFSHLRVREVNAVPAFQPPAHVPAKVVPKYTLLPFYKSVLAHTLNESHKTKMYSGLRALCRGVPVRWLLATRTIVSHLAE